MRGKKIDTEYVASFLSECAKEEIFSLAECLELAKNKVQQITDNIVELHKQQQELTKQRAKILHVVLWLSQKQHQNETLDLRYYQIPQLHLAKQICQDLKQTNIKTTDANVLKQLIILDIIRQENNLLSEGSNYNSFMEFINNILK